MIVFEAEELGLSHHPGILSDLLQTGQLDLAWLRGLGTRLQLLVAIANASE